MCGIAGIIGRPTPRQLQNVPEVMKRLYHRGPNDGGWLRCYHNDVQVDRTWTMPERVPEALLLHRRLSIIDLSVAGFQPMSSRDRRYWIVYNGEIYNYAELRAELEQLGQTFVTRTDTEVLLTAYSVWGANALKRFVGMFAFALLDTRRRTVLLARDFFGIKPLYYTTDGGNLAFASEVKALLGFMPSNPHVNPQKVYVYLRYGISDAGPDTVLEQVHQVPAGHYIEVNLDDPTKLEPVHYWRPSTDERLDISFDEAATRLRDMFVNNVRLHLRSDVPVGAALSGGIDSSSILLAMREVAPNLDLHAFSYISDASEISEEHWIDIAARAAGAQVHKLKPSAEDLLSDLEDLMYTQDGPFGSTSLYAQYCVFRGARQAGVTVMLDGQGADEVLGGYRFYMSARLASLIRQGAWGEATKFVNQCARWPGMSRSGVLFRAMDFLLPRSLQEPARKLIGKEMTPSWINSQWFCDRGIAPSSLNCSESSDVLRETLCHTIVQNTLPGLLRYEDRNSMAFSIESRVPFLTPEMVNFLLALPEQYIIASDGTSKAVFRKAMRGLVPDAILDRRDKIGFATPEQKWLKKLGPWVESLLSSGSASPLPCLRWNRVKEEWSAIASGSRPFTPYVWRWLNLIQWTKQFQVQWQ